MKQGLATIGCVMLVAMCVDAQPMKPVEQPPAVAPPLLDERIKELIRAIDKRTVSAMSPYMLRIPSYPSVNELAHIGKPAVRYLIAELGNPKHSRGYAAIALGKIGPDAVEAVPDLIKLLDYPPHRYDAIVALGQIGKAANEAVAPLRRVLRETVVTQRTQSRPPTLFEPAPDKHFWMDEWGIDAATATALGEIGDEAAKGDLIGALSRKGREWRIVREAAAEALGLLGDLGAVGPLASAACDTEGSVRRQAVLSLGNMAHADAVAPLVGALEDETPGVRWAVFHSLALLAERLDASLFVPSLAAALDKRSAFVQQQVIDMLTEENYTQTEKLLQMISLTAQHQEQPLWKIEFPGRAVDYVCHFPSGDLLLAGRSLHRLDVSGRISWKIDIPPLDITCPPAVDNECNTFLAGRANGQLALAKIDPNGKLVWNSHVEGLAADRSRATAITVSTDTRVLVMGTHSRNGVRETRVFLASFSPLGEHVNLLLGDNPSAEGAFCLPQYSVLDSISPKTRILLCNDGSSFVPYHRFSGSPKLVIARFDIAGRLLCKFACDEFGSLHLNALLVDESGCLYIVGSNASERGMVAKVDALGKKLWTRVFEGHRIMASAMANGRLYVSWNRFPAKNAAVIQEVVLRDGSAMASRHVFYDQGIEGTGFVHALSVDSEGNANLVVNWEKHAQSEGGGMGFVSPRCMSFGLRRATITKAR